MNDEPVLLFMKVMCVLAYVYIAAAAICCIHWLIRRERKPRATCAVGPTLQKTP